MKGKQMRMNPKYSLLEFMLFFGVFAMLVSAQAFGISMAGTERTELLFENSDFECGDLRNWTASGNAFEVQPVKGDNSALRNKPAGPQGIYWIGTCERYNGKIGEPGGTQGDGKTGSLTSVDFTVRKNALNFLTGGGMHPAVCAVEIWVEDKLFYSETGQNKEQMTPSSVDMSSCLGREAHIVIRDEATGGWGHINADAFTASDEPVVKAQTFSRDLTINGKYLLVPVRNSQRTTSSGTNDALILQLTRDGSLLREFRVLLPENGTEADWVAFYPVEAFAGETVTLKSQQKLPDRFLDAVRAVTVSDSVPGLDTDYDQPYRDQFHYTMRRGKNNDVNGLVYNNGTYHLYYQYNPFNICWDNMHWGHASGTDLVHWVEQDIALYAKSMNDMAFSGGGFMDSGNTSGVGRDGIVPQFAAFTSTGRGECLAYSMDGGFKFTELPENPVVQHHGRDPKVIWYAPEQKWIMAVFDITDGVLEPLPAADIPEKHHKNSVAFYSSVNLTDWVFESRFIHPDRKAIHECPELFEIAVEGKPDETRYILYGVENRYFIGKFDGHEFVAESGPFNGEVGISRAAQMVSDAPNGRHIQMAWAKPAYFLNRWPHQRYSNGFLLPKKVTLRETDDGLRLFFYPVPEIDTLRSRKLIELENPSAAEVDQAMQSVAGKLLDVAMEYHLNSGAGLQLTVNGQAVSADGSGSLRILSDRTITEAFVNEGQKGMSFRRPEETFDDTRSGFSLSGGGAVTSLTVYEMASIWPK